MTSLPMVWRLVVSGLALSANAAGQNASWLPLPYAELVRASRDSDSNVHWFKLELPLIGKPLWMSVQTGSAPTYEMLRWPTYDWQTLLLSQGPLSIAEFNRVKPAIELDCSSKTCAPTQEMSTGLEMRLNMGGRGVLPENYLYLQRPFVVNPVRNFQRTQIGFGGLLDL